MKRPARGTGARARAPVRRSRERVRTAGSTPKRGGSGAPEIAQALRLGIANARGLIAERERLRRRVRAAAGPRRARAAHRLLVAEGDSWFQYPFYNTLEALEDGYGYETESVAHAGDTLEGMAYDPPQLGGLVRLFAKLADQQRMPDAVLLSAGGNDLATSVLWTVLNHGRGPRPGFDPAVVTAVIDDRMRLAYAALIGAVTEHHRVHFGGKPRILVHGYDHPVPDGRGYAGGAWVLPGPWLEPQFRGRGYAALDRCTLHMRAMIDRFNEMLAALVRCPGLEHVRHVDLRGTLSAEVTGRAYRRSWANELHPTVEGFRQVAARFARALDAP